jgi:hypothetical protein
MDGVADAVGASVFPRARISTAMTTTTMTANAAPTGQYLATMYPLWDCDGDINRPGPR